MSGSATSGASTEAAQVPPEGRNLAPDLARGMMLLLIALANTPWYIWGRAYSVGSVHPMEGSVLDRAVQVLTITFVDYRVYPMFAFLVGYGLMTVLARQRAAGRSERAVRGVLRRRNLWLLVFGAAHAALLFGGDILGAYGLAGLVIGGIFLRRSDRVLLVAAGVGTTLLALIAAWGLLLGWAASAGRPVDTGPAPWMLAAPSFARPDYLVTVIERLIGWLFLTPLQGLLTMVVPVALLLGFWAARRGVLADPARHRTLLRRTAVVGITVGVVVGLPCGLVHVGALPVAPGVEASIPLLGLPSGLAAGLGYVALFGLFAARRAQRSPTPVTRAITAVGERSLSCYLAQSVLSAPLLAAWGLGWGVALSSTGAAGFAVAVWLVTLVGASLLARAGRRGPAEVLLRRLIYGRPAPVPA